MLYFRSAKIGAYATVVIRGQDSISYSNPLIYGTAAMHLWLHTAQWMVISYSNGYAINGHRAWGSMGGGGHFNGWRHRLKLTERKRDYIRGAQCANTYLASAGQWTQGMCREQQIYFACSVAANHMLRGHIHQQ